MLLPRFSNVRQKTSGRKRLYKAIWNVNRTVGVFLWNVLVFDFVLYFVGELGELMEEIANTVGVSSEFNW